MKKIIIIGAGIGGLSAAALLAKKGYSVTILEKNKQPGGRAGVLSAKGFTFDMGPSWYLMPDVFENFYKEFGKKPSDFLQLKKLDPSYKIFFSESESTEVPGKYTDILKLFAKMEPNGRQKLEKYMENSEFLYKKSMETFLYNDFRKITDFFRPDVMKNGAKLHLFENMDKFTKKYFDSDKLRKILLYNIVFLGGTPSNTPALYSLMSYVDFKMGVFYPMGGITEFINSLVSICKDYKVKIKYDENVKSIKISEGKAEKVITQKQSYEADIVISNADYHFTETKLLPKTSQTYPESYWKKKTIAPSAFILYIGVNKKLPKLEHHNLYLDSDWTLHFESIFNKPSWPDKPSYYVCAPSKTDKSVAPKGMENLFILVPVAAGLKDTPAIRKKYTDQIIKHLEGIIGEDFKENIVYLKTFAHNDFSELYNSYKGSALGLSHALLQSALFTPGHISKKVKNLYYTGANNHPGIGMPTCLISSQIVTSLIEKHEK